jgi:hypothetical protein
MILLSWIIFLNYPQLISNNKNTGCLITIMKNQLCNDNLLTPFHGFIRIFNIKNVFIQYSIPIIIIIINIVKINIH